MTRLRTLTRLVPVCLMAAAVLAGCAEETEPKLLNLRANRTGPDEFSILPNKPLQQPADFAALPDPTPGGANLADPTPQADAYAALGGAARGGAAQDPGLLSYATRFGVRPGIRPELAAADLDYRRRNDGRLLERLFDVNVYFRAYEAFSLDKYRELKRLRAAGVRTPSVPPEGGQ